MTRSATDFAGVVDDMLRRVLLPAHHDDPAIVGPARAMARRVGPQAYRRQQQAIIGRADSRPHLRDIECPTLVMCGRQDVVTPVEVHEEMRDAIAGAQLVVIGECGHLSPMERGPEVTGALRSFIERLRGASAA
jgi:pimeloyl-ACP methyl ester carboxylesterase